ncbi:sphingoid long chain base kinase-like protein [Xylona heveae TC161]|uniref:Sphingoid long chain base kinase-like protein n=1 Tax=Xylona heveae (strain CBS 132557 / TC161) TaxID=1328760 RepID=A0A165JL87_XYLHT|nr:sphingoid long chain base kinase-like protein [Xylona heveae TC161]KZF26380.1 sphingoid long chain base kinase-like protein [Xylona heveae TC161]
MTASNQLEGDPFSDVHADSTGAEDLRVFTAESTLTLDANASLTLGSDALIIFDEGFVKREARNCCGILPNGAKATRTIPLFNILWADLAGNEIAVHYAQRLSKNEIRAASYRHSIQKIEPQKAAAWVSRLLDYAYGKAQQRKRIKVLVNPFGGQGKARTLFSQEIKPIFAAARCELDVQETEYQGHAVTITEALDINKYDVIACCSGDGLPHEVFNGLGKRADARRALARLAVVQLPCGSGNAMSWNLAGTDSASLCALSVIKGVKTPLDLVSITQGGRRTLSFLSQSVGVVAECDLGTENLRWMGSARFTWGFLVRLLGQTVYPCDLAVAVELDDKASIRERYCAELGNRAPISTKRGPFTGQGDNKGIGDGLPTLKYGTVNDKLPEGWSMVPYDKMGNFYAGNMAYMAADANFFPATLPNDGCLDLICIDGDIGRMSALKTLLAVEGGTFFDMPHVKYQKISGYRISPKDQEDGYISIDGERVPFEPFQAEVHRGLGTVLSKSGNLYEAPGVA